MKENVSQAIISMSYCKKCTKKYKKFSRHFSPTELNKMNKTKDFRINFKGFSTQILSHDKMID